MPTEVVTALIAAMAASIAAIVSYITGHRQAKIEIEKFRSELQSCFGGKLFEKRLDVYPELYRHISDLIKTMRYGEISKETVIGLFERWQEWDSRHAILFSAYTHGICSPVRHEIGRLSQLSDDDLRSEIDTMKARQLLKLSLQRVELALRHELGVFAFESPTDFEEIERRHSYEAAHLDAGLEKKEPTQPSLAADGEDAAAEG